MKRLLSFFSLLLSMSLLLSSCSFVKQSVDSFSVSSFEYQGATYTRAHNWYIDIDNADYRAEIITEDDVDYDVRIYGENDEFIYLEISGDEYHSDTAPFPENTADSINSIEILTGASAKTVDDPGQIAAFCTLLDSGDYTTDEPSDLRYLYTYNITYKDCPAVFGIGALVGSGDQYYFRCDGVGGEVFENERYYPVPDGFLS